jgi:hypothetical protein
MRQQTTSRTEWLVGTSCEQARWSFLQAQAKQVQIRTLIDDALEAIEKENASLKGVLPKDYARSAVDAQRIGELIDLIGTIGLGDAESRSKNILGPVIGSHAHLSSLPVPRQRSNVAPLQRGPRTPPLARLQAEPKTACQSVASGSASEKPWARANISRS